MAESIISPGRPDVSERRRLVLGIEGMTCTSCSARVERALNKMPGVQASVNFATGRATVDVPPAVDESALAAAVSRVGYVPVPVVDEPFSAGDAEQVRARSLWRRFVVALVLFVPLSNLAVVAALAPTARFPGWQWLLVVLCAPVVTWCAWPFHRAAAVNAAHGAGTMDTLVSTGIIVATLWSCWSMFTVDPHVPIPDGLWAAMSHSGSIYLETASGITVLVLGGRYLEARARARAGQAVRALAALTAKEVTVLLADGSQMRLPAGELKNGQQLVCAPGDRIAADGTVHSGRAAVDTSAMTGESLPREVFTDDEVSAGHLVMDGRLIITATAVADQTQLAGMIRLVEQAQQSKSATQRLVDRISIVFVPAILAVAVLTAAGWLMAGAGIDRALTAALSALVVACPCALGLATPVALLAASGRGARHGIFVRDQDALDSGRNIDLVLWDKTGTITEGTLQVVQLYHAGGPSRQWLLLAAAVEAASGHPIGRAIVARSGGPEGLLPVDDFEATIGIGVGGRVAGHRVRVCRPGPELHLSANLRTRVAADESAGRTVVAVLIDESVAGLVVCADTVKESAARVVQALHGRGIRSELLTGDNAGAATAVGAHIGADAVHSKLLPADKVAVIRGHQAAGRRVAMVGDGVNDGPALAIADLGIAVGAGTDVALEAADVILVRDDLDGVAESLALARATVRTIRWNLVWAFGYNLAAVPIAVAGLANPLVASAAMALSSLLVVTNSLRLDRTGSLTHV